jgi:subtilisin family serine protease
MRRLLSHLLVAALLVGVGVNIGAGRGPSEPAWAAMPGGDAGVRSAPAADPAVTETDRLMVEFDARADLGGADRIDDKRARGRFVRDRLVATATRSQAQAKALVEGTQGATAESFWLRNVMIVDGAGHDLVRGLAGLEGVREVRRERVYPLVEPIPAGEAIAQAVGDPEWGVARIGADSAWDQGVLGGGVVVANIDTGVEFTHPAIVQQYRGNLGDGSFRHDYNWWDPTGVCGETPCDEVGHGTHVMGTMVGGDGPGPFQFDIGVAPGARWIAAKGCESSGCSEGSLLSSGQFVLAPSDLSGANPDPGRAPHIVNNSWGGPPGEAFYLETVQAWRAAGIIPVFAAGNSETPYCGSGGSPGDYLEALSVGATDSDDMIAEFSDRGPSVFGKVNPDVSAPGVDVLSSVPGGGYEAHSGTSMAAPHTAGALALVLSAQPELLGSVEKATAVLRDAALRIEDLSCGGDESGVPNNVYGYGRIDAAAAVEVVATGGRLVGTVTDAGDGGPIGGARLTATGPDRTSSTFSRADGTFRLLLAAGTYVVSAGAFGYETGFVAGVEIVTDETTTVDLALVELPRFTVSGRVVSAENGGAVADASVRTLGTPVPAATTDNRGRYTLTLPVGAYTLEASKGGCMQRSQAEVEVLGPVTQDLTIARKLDRYGHGCDPIRFNWANVDGQTALYGADVYGRLRLPFDFPFYGERYAAVFVDSNGYLTFEEPFSSWYLNIGIPSASTPNAAIYPLWQDLVIDEEAALDYVLSSGSAVLEYRNVRSAGRPARGDLQVRLHRDGTIDMHYGRGIDDLGAGSRATIGLEDATGTDALQFGVRDLLLAPNTAYRYSRVATSLIRGTVTDANDGLPVEGATLVAMPGGQNAQTGPDGTYELRVIDGAYVVEASAPNYVTDSASVSVRPNRTVTVDFSVRAARAEVTPTSLSASVEAGETAEETVTISNTGSAPLTFQVRERDLSGVPPDLPPVEVEARIPYEPGWGSQPRLPAEVRANAAAAADQIFDGDLETIIEDPAGDSRGAVDIVAVRAGMDDAEVSFGIDYTPGTPMHQVVAQVHLDVDQDPSTGLPPDALDGKPTQDIGVDYFVIFVLPGRVAYVYTVETFDIVAAVPFAVDGRSVRFDIPLAVFDRPPEAEGLDVTVATGDSDRMTDWAPDVGHGTVGPFRDAPWMTVDPDAGTLEAGESQQLTVALGGEGVEPGDYEGELILQTNDPRTPSYSLDVTLEVALPADFGAVGGTVTDAFTGEPIAGATVEMAAEHNGAPYPISALTGGEGGYLLFGPAGTWDVETAADGYLPAATQVTIVEGRRARLDVALDAILPRAVVEGGPFDFLVPTGGSAGGDLVIRNEGFADLEFSIGERPVAAAPRPEGAAVLVVMDTPPMDSTALLELFEAEGIVPDVADSSAMGTIDLDTYDLVVVAGNHQPQEFYDRYNGNVDRFEDFATAGGLLWVSAATGGQGEFRHGVLPGGVMIVERVFEERNRVTDPTHPAMAGVPDPFSSSDEYTSDSAFDGLLPGTDVIATGSGSELPTLIEYDLGDGRVLATGQTLEAGFEFGGDTGLILRNLVPYVAAWVRLGDVPWLSVAPVEGTLAPGEEILVRVGVDADGLEPGTHEALLVVRTNDPHNRRIGTSVRMEVTPV